MLTFSSMMSGTSAKADMIEVSGTGIALGIAKKLAIQVHTVSPEESITVLPSMGSGGGLKALRDGVIGASFSARKLKDSEKSIGLQESHCMRTPLVFATRHQNPGNFNLADLPAIYGDTLPSWEDGTQLKVILRSRSGSEIPYLASKVPGLGEQFKKAFKRPDTAIGTSDQINAGLVRTISGSLAIMTLLQIKAEELNLNLVSIDGVAPSAAAVADQSYPFSLRVCLVLPKEPTPLARKLAAQMVTPEGQKMIIKMGATPSE
ncbi:substrate-binding domain-containing protein [Nisaea sp.]|uniref:PstS family phosphate ABC transporter substrate-binding protein n=2 Tax=Alphaproteobacteria TaxID=28211 RepID=UPI0032669FD5